MRKIFVLFLLFMLSMPLHGDVESMQRWTLNTPADGGNCQLDSSYTDMQDGYQTTRIQLQVTPDAVILQSKAPLDGGYVSNGLQVLLDDPAARQQIKQAQDVINAHPGLATMKEADLKARIVALQDNIAKVKSHQWFQDYRHNPINAARLDKELQEAETELKPIMQYQTALQQRTGAEAAFAKLVTYPLIVGDRIVKRKTLEFSSQREALISGFSAGDYVRVQLRFWPTWPETGTHQALVSLHGFKGAYRSFQECLNNN